MIAAAGNEFAGGVIFLFIGLLIVALAILWIVFPVLVLSKFNELLKVEREAMKARAELAKALQWMVDNWKDEGSKPPPV
ncbi:MAG: hypothetical protein E6L08_06950 [Verrucomicrobia bacterium]|nr:MAG: hypothetical protein E6L08_06950 [Verrucomicrobiota bacterium]